jgi:sensor domain CHASE-containing protein
MTRLRLAVFTGIGAAIWALFFFLGFTIGWGLFAQYLIGLVICAVCLVATWENYAAWRIRYRERQRERAVVAARARITQTKMVDRQRRALAIADMIEAAPEHEKQRLQREAEALGYLDDDSRMVS